MFPFRPKRGLVSAQDLQYKDLPYKENIFLSAVHPPQPQRDRGSSGYAVITQVPSVVPSEELANPSRQHLEQR